MENEKKKMVYISGRISGNKNYKKEFRSAEEYLQNQGYIPINPINNRGNYKELIDRGIKQLMECDAIFVLDNGVVLSKGAMLELNYARTVGMEIIFQEGTQRNHGYKEPHL